MSQTTLTSKGQVPIPKNVRDSLGLHVGDKIEFVITEKVDDVFGILHKPGRPAVTVEEMEAGIKQKIRESFQ
jgi:AbrB family looped-hinge helix DNA binding protein